MLEYVPTQAWANQTKHGGLISYAANHETAFDFESESFTEQAGNSFGRIFFNNKRNTITEASQVRDMLLVLEGLA